VKVKAKVSDATESIYTPCRYLLKQVEVLNGDKVQDIVETVSLRGRFCEQAMTGESVVIQGKLEKVVAPNNTHHRVVLGGNPSDYMISLSLLHLSI
jgi:predicted nucleotidyltransferase